MESSPKTEAKGPMVIGHKSSPQETSNSTTWNDESLKFWGFKIVLPNLPTWQATVSTGSSILNLNRSFLIARKITAANKPTIMLDQTVMYRTPPELDAAAACMTPSSGTTDSVFCVNLWWIYIKLNALQVDERRLHADRPTIGGGVCPSIRFRCTKTIEADRLKQNIPALSWYTYEPRSTHEFQLDDNESYQIMNIPMNMNGVLWPGISLVLWISAVFEKRPSLGPSTRIATREHIPANR